MRTRAAAFRHADREQWPQEQRRALRSAIRWQFFTIGYTICTITLVAFVLGGSQAMKTAWIEDMLSLLPQLAFLIALLFVRRAPDREHPYGWHRIMGVGHLLAGAALLAVGSHLGFEAASGLIAARAPDIGTIEIFGNAVWLGWVMVAVMVLAVVGPVFLYGPAKARIAPVLHNKLLSADADMAKADWQTNAASIVGVLGAGAGIWWLDGAAAAFISLGIVFDGLRNTGSALQDLMDRRARAVDDRRPHPLAGEILSALRALDWVDDAAIRLRDLGQVFHVEAFVRPCGDSVRLEQLDEAAAAVFALDWKIHEVVVAPSDALPHYADRGEDAGDPPAPACSPAHGRPSAGLSTGSRGSARVPRVAAWNPSGSAPARASPPRSSREPAATRSSSAPGSRDSCPPCYSPERACG